MCSYSVWAGLPGQEAGNGLVDVLYGAVNPSGRLPWTIAKTQSDYPAQIQLQDGNLPYSEGYATFFHQAVLPSLKVAFLRLLVDYRWFDAVCLIAYSQMQS